MHRSSECIQLCIVPFSGSDASGAIARSSPLLTRIRDDIVAVPGTGPWAELCQHLTDAAMEAGVAFAHSHIDDASVLVVATDASIIDARSLSLALTPVTRAPSGEAACLTEAQIGIYPSAMVRETDPANRIKSVFEVFGTVDDDALCKALEDLSRRHDALRLRIGVQPKGIVQWDSGEAIAAPRVDLRSARGDRSTRRALALQTAEAFVAAPYDLTSGPVFRAGAFRYENDGLFLAFGCHHLAADGWSLGILNRDLTMLYRSALEDCIEPVSAAPSWFGMVRATDMSASPSGSARSIPERAAWAGELRRLEVCLPSLTVGRLEAAARQSNCTPFHALLAGFLVAQRRLSGSWRSSVGFVHSARFSTAELSTVGCAAVVRTVELAVPSPRPDLLTDVRSAVSRALTERHATEAAKPLVVLHNQPVMLPDLPGATVERVDAQDSIVRAPFRLSLWPRHGAWSGVLDLRADYYPDNNMDALWSTIAESLDQVALAVLEHPRESSRGDGPSIGEARRRRVDQFTVPIAIYDASTWPSRVDVLTHDIDSALAERGALVLRGLRISGSQEFMEFVQTVDSMPVRYEEPSTPRTHIASNIYTSTDYPASEAIPFHSEMAYASSWPSRLYFWCEAAPESDGETPLASTRRTMERLRADVLDRFVGAGVQYQRVFHPRIGLDWSSVFAVDRADVLEECRRRGVQAEWTQDGALRTVWRGPARRPHPATGTDCWFNHALIFNGRSQPRELQEATARVFADKRLLPLHTRYGDGMPIPVDVIREIANAYGSASWQFKWQAGDLLVVDNFQCAHGRRPYVGKRRILVAMTRPVSS
jgi:Taurine catabolism dioxygenase TauD, TfdA family/Condensation domain